MDNIDLDLASDRVEVLLVEDDPADLELTRLALARSSLPLRVTVASTGAEALERLRSRKPLPDFVLMDLHGSRTDGFDALREIREDPLLRELKVIVVNAADEQDHAALSRSLHATAHVKRSTGLRGFLEAVRCIEELWFAELQNEMCSNRSLMETRVCNGADLVIET